MIFNFACQLYWAKCCPDRYPIWPGMSACISLKEITIWIRKQGKDDYSHQCKWPSSRPLKALMEWKGEERIFSSMPLVL